MKKFIFLTTLSFLPFLVKAQNLKNPLPPDAFNRMVVQDITYAIVGENTPTTGLKADVSKPEGTLSAMFPINYKSKFPFDVVGIEFKAGVSNKNFNFFKGFEISNSAFELRPSFHYIPYSNSAELGKANENVANKKIALAQNQDAVFDAAAIIDTLYVVNTLYNHHLDVLGERKPLPPQIKGPGVEHEKIAIYLIKTIMQNPHMKFARNAGYANIIAQLPKATLDTTQLLVATPFYNKLILWQKHYEALYKRRDEAMMDKMISNVNGNWTRKNYHWFTLSPFIRSEKINEHFTNYEGRDSMYFKSANRYYYGLSLTANKYWLRPSKSATLIRISFTASKNNNLPILSIFDYQTRTPFFQYGTAVTEKIKTGAAYNNTDVKEGFDKQLSIDLYQISLKKYIPGFYVSLAASHSDLLNLPNVIGRQHDNFKLAAEGGLVINFNNRDKDKSLLSLMPYFRYEDLTDSRRTSTSLGAVPETVSEFQKRNISIGIKVGIPITLPKG